MGGVAAWGGRWMQALMCPTSRLLACTYWLTPCAPPAVCLLCSFGPIDGLQLGELLGRGAFGRVYRGRWKGAVVAVKVVDHRVQVRGGRCSGGVGRLQAEVASLREHAGGCASGDWLPLRLSPATHDCATAGEDAGPVTRAAAQHERQPPQCSANTQGAWLCDTCLVCQAATV